MGRRDVGGAVAFEEGINVEILEELVAGQTLVATHAAFAFEPYAVRHLNIFPLPKHLRRPVDAALSILFAVVLVYICIAQVESNTVESKIGVETNCNRC